MPLVSDVDDDVVLREVGIAADVGVGLLAIEEQLAAFAFEEVVVADEAVEIVLEEDAP